MINIFNLPRIMCSALMVALLLTTMPDAANALTGAERRAAAAAKRAEAQAEAEARRSGEDENNETQPPSPPANNPPSIAGTPATTVELGQPYSFRPTVSDVDGDSLTFSIGGKPSWAQFSSSTGQLSGTPTSNSHVGTTGSIWISVSDGEAAANLRSFIITVTAPPVVVPPPVPPVEPPVTPPPADGLVSATLPTTYRWDTLTPGQRVYVDRTYTLVDVPADYVGWRLLQTENDDKYVSEPERVSFSVAEPVRVIVGYDRRISARPGWLQTYSPTGNVIRSSNIAYDAYYRDFPAGRVTLGGNENGFSNYTVAIAPLDEVPASTPPPDPEPVPPVTENTPPTISGRPLSTVQLGSLYSFTPAASDADGDELTFSITNKPSWAQFDSRSGRLRGTPTANSHVGSSSVIRISVSDGRASVSLYFRITVTPPPATEPPATEPPVTEPPVIEPPVIEPPVTPPPADDLVSAAQPSEYRWDTLAPGKRVYVDRYYEFATIPADYAGWRYLRTRNNDKFFADPDRVRFDVYEARARDRRIRPANCDTADLAGAVHSNR